MAKLAEEILSSPSDENFMIASEHQLCRRFNISRVTVRLALSDLEARGLIYRRHGKGTFAFGRINQKYQQSPVVIVHLGALNSCTWAETEVIRGLQSQLHESDIPVTIIGTHPADWSTEQVKGFGSVALFPENVTEDDLLALRDRKLPFLFLKETSLPGPKLRFNHQESAQTLTQQLLSNGHGRIALLTGFEKEMDSLKRLGVHTALKAENKELADAPEFSAEDGGVDAAINRLLSVEPRPTAVIAFDDTLAFRLIQIAQTKFNLRVPHDLTVASFHGAPFLAGLEDDQTLVRFDFFGAGRRVAQVITHAAITGREVEDIVEKATFPAGQTAVVLASA